MPFCEKYNWREILNSQSFEIELCNDPSPIARFYHIPSNKVIYTCEKCAKEYVDEEAQIGTLGFFEIAQQVDGIWHIIHEPDIFDAIRAKQQFMMSERNFPIETPH